MEGSTPATPARQSKFTPDRVERILKAARLGVKVGGCAASGGVAPSTMHRWLMRGEAGEAGYAEFGEQWAAARAAGESRLVKIVVAAAMEGPKNWTAAMTLLERSFGYTQAAASLEAPVMREMQPGARLARLREALERTDPTPSSPAETDPTPTGASE